MGVDGQDLSDWDAPTITAEGNPSVTEIDCPTKLSNDGYDWCFELASSGIPYHVEDSWKSINIEQRALSGVNPSDNIVVTFATSGYYIATNSEEMKMGYFKDDSGKTYVYHHYNITLEFT
jgi:hypothetical protein